MKSICLDWQYRRDVETRTCLGNPEEITTPTGWWEEKIRWRRRTIQERNRGHPDGFKEIRGNNQMMVEILRWKTPRSLKKTGIGGVQSLPFWELIRERLGSLLYITYVWKACRINMTRCGKHESVDFGGSAELERTTHQAEREWAPPTISCS